jgi:prephenate dehydrogenase
MYSNTHSRDEVVIIGASGGMGRSLQRNLAELGISVTGLDKSGGVGTMTEDALSLSQVAIGRISRAGLVIIAVDDQKAIQVASTILPFLHADAVLMDCTSVKSAYCKAIAGISPCAKVSINPLFGPGLKWSNGTMTVTRITDGPAVEHWLEVFRRMGVDLLLIDSETHDRVSAEMQAAVHALIMAYFVSIDDSSSHFAPPPRQLLSLMSARMLSSEAHVYWSIQVNNPFAKEARLRLQHALQRLDQMFDAKDKASFQAIWKTRRDELGAQLGEREAKCRQIIEFMRSKAHE